RGVWVGHEEVQEGVDQVVGQLAPCGPRPKVPHDRLTRALTEAFEDRLPELLLAPPVVVECAEGNARTARHLAGGGGPVALPAEGHERESEAFRRTTWPRARGAEADELTGVVRNALPSRQDRHDRAALFSTPSRPASTDFQVHPPSPASSRTAS